MLKGRERQILRCFRVEHEEQRGGCIYYTRTWRDKEQTEESTNRRLQLHIFPSPGLSVFILEIYTDATLLSLLRTSILLRPSDAKC
jgi:hypothetical protein